ncbi:hypothetical protein [Polaromonas sp.]|uniref:hypothetical protein n=1 Tax=Polaromonas sp. TaxID=1869339 RepID=UPI003BAA1C8D
MIEWLWIRILRFPDATRLLGHALMGASFILGMFGWRAHKILGLLDRRLGRVGLEAPQSLAEMYPDLPTWWIPESPIGFTLVCLVFFIGALTAWLGKTAFKQIR